MLGVPPQHLGGKGLKLRTPLTEAQVRSLALGEKVELSGTIVTARDAAHKHLIGHEAPCDLNVIYHCGPIVKGGKVVSAGPTTSVREEPYEAKVIERFGVRAVIGKGGMGEMTQKALQEHGCVYLAAVGGAGALIAERIKAIKAVYLLRELGSPEAFWVFEVEDLPLIVAMDSSGGSLYRDVEEASAKSLRKLLNSR
jgi:tartrate/fumarate subfamily iron-sulfur-dependent hydro-lyase beta chain